MGNEEITGKFNLPVFTLGGLSLIVLLLLNEITITLINPYIMLSSNESILFLFADFVSIVVVYLCFFKKKAAIILIRWLVQNWSYILLLVLFLFLSMELLIRHFYTGIFPTYRKADFSECNNKNLYESSDYFAFKLKSNFNLRVVEKTYNLSFLLNTDSDGFRLGSRANTKQNILVIGDSLTFGFVDNEDTYSNQLQKLIGNEANVYNSGVPSWGFAEYYLAYKLFMPKLNPKIIVVGIFPSNDFDDLRNSSWQGKYEGKMPTPPLIRTGIIIDKKGNMLGTEIFYKLPLIRSSAAIDYIRFAIGKKLYKILNDTYMRFTNKQTDEELSLKIMADMSQNNKARFIFVVIPAKSQLKTKYSPMSRYVRELKKINGAETVDMFPIFKSNQNSIYLPDKSHLNPKGNKIIADLLHKLIMERSLLQHISFK